MLRCKLRLFVARITTSAHVAKSKSDIYFLQLEKLVREVVIRVTNNLNLQRNIVARQVARKCYQWLSYITKLLTTTSKYKET